MANDRVVVTPRGGGPRSVPLPPIEWTGPWGTLEEFADSIEEGRESETSGRNNLGTIAMMDAAVESARRREPLGVAAASRTLAV